MLRQTISGNNSRGIILAVCLTFLLAFILRCLAETIEIDNKTNEENFSSNPSLIKDVEKVCSDKKVPIESIKKMEKIVLMVNENEKICPCRYKASINELYGILKYPREKLCSEDAFYLIKSYHFRFISPPKELNKRLTQFDPHPQKVVRAQLYSEPRTYRVQLDDYDQVLMIPQAIRHFFLAFALQLSAQCKRNLLSNLKLATKKVLINEDYEILDVMKEQNPIGEIMKDGLSVVDFDNVLYIPELEGEIKNLKDSAVNKRVFVTMKVAKDSALHNLIESCQLRLKSIYDELFMPVIKLTKLGYNYLGDQLTLEEREALKGDEVKRWLAVVHVCEMFDKVIAIKRSWSHEENEDEKGSLESSDVSGEGEPEVKSNGEELENEGVEESVQVLEREERGNLWRDKSVRVKPSEYKAERLNVMEDEMWIYGSSRQLDLELSRKSGASNPFGLRGFLRRASRKIKRQFAKLDFKKFAHYRRNSAWYSGFLNFISAVSNVASITTTLYFTFLLLL